MATWAARVGSGSPVSSAESNPAPPVVLYSSRSIVTGLGWAAKLLLRHYTRDNHDQLASRLHTHETVVGHRLVVTMSSSSGSSGRSIGIAVVVVAVVTVVVGHVGGTKRYTGALGGEHGV